MLTTVHYNGIGQATLVRHLAGQHDQREHGRAGLSSAITSTTRYLEHDPIVVGPLIGHGISSPSYGQVGRHRVVIKPAIGLETSTYPNERAAYVLDQHLKGLVNTPPTTLRKTSEGTVVVSQYVAGDHIRDHAYIFNPSHQDFPNSLRQAQNFALFDTLVNNHDRHARNALYNPITKKIIAIDHGRIFIPAARRIIGLFESKKYFNGIVNTNSAHALHLDHLTLLDNLLERRLSITRDLSKLVPTKMLDEMFNRTTYMLKHRRLITNINQLVLASNP